MPPFGLGKAGRLRPLAAAKTARERFRATGTSVSAGRFAAGRVRSHRLAAVV